MRIIKCECGAVVKTDPKEMIILEETFMADKEVLNQEVFTWICFDCGREYYLPRQMPKYNLNKY